MSHHESIIGKTFGKLQVIKLDHITSMLYKPKDGSNPYTIDREYYLCKCECGQLCTKAYSDLVKYPGISCGCNHIKKTYKDVRIGMLVGTGARKRMGRSPGSGKPPAWHWEFKCDCGNTVWKTNKQIRSYKNNMHQDLPANCGCMNTKHTSIIRSRNHNENSHGLSKTRIYNIWSGMRWRCSDKATGVMYRQYYNRGIRVCDEWNDPNDTAGSFKRFYDWAMTNGYADNLTIDRIDNDGPYAPWNCRWVTFEVQSVNKSSNKHIRYGDKIYTYSELSDIFGTPSGFIAAMKYRGYSINLIIHNLLHPEDRFQLRKDGCIIDYHGYQRLLPKYDAEFID